jgi:PAS domain S-box-containing protein
MQNDLIQGQIQLYEMIVSGKPLKDMLSALVLFVESQTPGMICTILLLDENGQQMWTGAAPNFPSGLSAAIDGSSIGPSAGSCGTAAFRGENVFVENIETDPLWLEYKNVFLLHGLRACWSSPIFDEQRRVLGTFAMYFREPALPQSHDMELIDIATRIASACIRRKRDDQVLRRSHRQLELIYEHVAHGIFLLEVQPDFRFRILSVNATFLAASGLRIEQVIGKDVEKIFPASTHQLIVSKCKQAIEEKGTVQWEQAAIGSNGPIMTILVLNPVFDERGVCTKLVGCMHQPATGAN